MTERDKFLFHPRYAGPLDVFIQNEGSDEWLFVGQTTPFRVTGRLGKGHRYPDYRHQLTGESHTVRTEFPEGVTT